MMRKILAMAAIMLLFVPIMGKTGVAQGASINDEALQGTSLTIDLTPHNPPIILPDSGGTFAYTIEVSNNTQRASTFDVWTKYTLPDGSTQGPILGPLRFQLPAGWTSQRSDLSEFVAGEMPPGTYTYTAYLGRYPSAVRASDSFTFEKQATTPGWYPQNSGTSEVLSSVDFVDTETGWVVGQNTVLHTSDGGDNWYEQVTPTYYNYTAVDFLDSQVGWVVGGFGTILHSTDGGQSWTVQDSGYTTGAYSWSDVQFLDANNGWVVGGYNGSFGETGRIILHTSDGGAHWQTQLYEDSQEVLVSLSFVDANHGWAVSGSSNLLYTDNGGATWTPQDPGQGNFYRDVFFIDTNRGWIADSYNGQVLRTTDGGMTWTAYDVGQPIYVESLYFADANTGWLAGGDNNFGKILYTNDGGQTWQEQYSGNLILFGLRFADAMNGWAVGWDGAILHTETGGS
jgi:photosystem II stability/assembly factor-like uncharacterized protein